ncbi:MAG TPA: hypothetical protein VG735_00280 [Caulobacterales bacterium]|nr:hypothetical protein [Caulobacterales bacterium]
MPASIAYDNETGRLRIINASGGFATKGHAFFTPLGPNGRACVTCHQPADGMSLSARTARKRWDATNGTDPLFAAIDGSNCPSLPQAERASHSLLLERGLIRIYLPWPPRAADGAPIKPEFSIEIVSDPTGCNTDPQYGLASKTPTISVFRRPRPVANMKYLLELPHGVPPSDVLFYNDKSLLPKNPETGGFASLQLMSDGRALTLKIQARDAALHHLQANGALSKKQLDEIEAFEKQIYAAQDYDKVGGALTGDGAPPGLGPAALRDGAPARLGNNPINRIFGSFAMWADPPVPTDETPAAKAQREFKRSVARGAELFYTRRFVIQDVGKYNDKGLGNPFKRSCGSGCHNTLLMGMDLAPGYMDLGLNNMPWANARPDLPLFKLVCRPDAPPQSYLGRVIYSHDPGRALTTGKCADIGASMTQQLRGLAARAPYFMNGSAANLRELVDFYDRRFNIGYNEQEKLDLVNFMSTL